MKRGSYGVVGVEWGRSGAPVQRCGGGVVRRRSDVWEEWYGPMRSGVDKECRGAGRGLPGPQPGGPG